MGRFGTEWASRKLNMPRRYRELKSYINSYAPEIKMMPAGYVLDIGCGPGDLLAICRSYGHHVMGVDDFNGNSGMGDAYTDLCRAHCRSFGVQVFDGGFPAWNTFGWERVKGKCCLVNMRGSIEQCLEAAMTGPPHAMTHNCRDKDWSGDPAPLHNLLANIASTLRPGGICLIHANGTKTTDKWYDRTVQEGARLAGLELVTKTGHLLHKWVQNQSCLSAESRNTA